MIREEMATTFSLIWIFVMATEETVVAKTGDAESGWWERGAERDLKWSFRGDGVPFVSHGMASGAADPLSS